MVESQPQKKTSPVVAPDGSQVKNNMIDNLLERSSLPGQTLIDPFMGSGVVIEAGLNRKLICTGFDIDPESYATSIERMAKLDESN